jgi:hypothetical protein
MKTIFNLLVLLQFIFFISCEKKQPEPLLKPFNYLDEPDFVKDGLIGYYPFNGDTKDYSGSENHAIASNPTYAVDRYNYSNGAIHFNGIDNFLTIPGFGLLLNGTEGTILIWSKSDTHYINTGQPKPVIFSLVDSIHTSFLLSANMGFLEYSFGNYPKLGGGSVNTTVNINGFKLFAFSFRDESITMYDYGNGIYTENTISNPAYSFGFAGDRKEQDLYLGKSIIEAFDSDTFDVFFTYFKGEIDDLLIYDRILTENEIKLLFSLAINQVIN